MRAQTLDISYAKPPHNGSMKGFDLEVVVVGEKMT